MSTKKYADLIVQSKEDADKALAPARADEQKAQLGISIAKLNVGIKGKQNALEALKAQYPLPIDAIVDAGDELALEQRRLQQLSELTDELFGS